MTISANKYECWKCVLEFEFTDFLKIDYKNSVQSITVPGFPAVQFSAHIDFEAQIYSIP